MFLNSKIQIPTITNFEQKTLDLWNSVGNFNIDLDSQEYKTSALRVIFKTAEQQLLTFNTTLLQIPVQTSKLLSDAKVKLDLPLVLKDSQNKYFQDNNMNFFAVDFLDSKINDLPISEQGVYFISKGIPSLEDKKKFSEIIGSMLPVGVVPKGNMELTWSNINGEQRVCLIQTTEKLDFYVKIKYKLATNFENNLAEFESQLKAEFLNVFNENYKVGKDFLKAVYEKNLLNKFSFGANYVISDLKIEYSLDAISYFDFSYSVPIMNFLELSEIEIKIEEFVN
jgi:hypothetical protein